MNDILNQLLVEYRPLEHQGAVIWLNDVPTDSPHASSRLSVREEHHTYEIHLKKEVMQYPKRLPKIASYL